jgi:hypothetical protein
MNVVLTGPAFDAGGNSVLRADLVAGAQGAWVPGPGQGRRLDRAPGGEPEGHRQGQGSSSEGHPSHDLSRLHRGDDRLSSARPRRPSPPLRRQDPAGRGRLGERAMINEGS